MSAEEADTPPAEQRVGAIVGDRLCVKCGFNLVGQPTIREPHYSLIIARCPECGTAAALQEYPLLGRWANRWAAVLGAAYLVTILSLFTIGSFSLFGSVYLIASAGAEELSLEIGATYFNDVIEDLRAGNTPANGVATQVQSYLQQAQVQIDATATPQVPGAVTTSPTSLEISDDAVAQARSLYLTQWPTVDAQWLKATDRSGILASVGGVDAALSEIPLSGWASFVVIAYVYAVVIAVIMPHRGRVWLTGFMLVPASLAMAWCFVWAPDPTSFGWGWGVPAGQVANADLFLRMRFFIIPAAFMVMLIGALTGRPLARLVVRALLPPRARGALAVLWLCDGRPLPRT